MTDEWTITQMEKMDLDEAGITGDQLAWLLLRVELFVVSLTNSVLITPRSTALAVWISRMP